MRACPWYRFLSRFSRCRVSRAAFSGRLAWARKTKLRFEDREPDGLRWRMSRSRNAGSLIHGFRGSTRGRHLFPVASPNGLFLEIILEGWSVWPRHHARGIPAFRLWRRPPYTTKALLRTLVLATTAGWMTGGNWDGGPGSFTA